MQVQAVEEARPIPDSGYRALCGTFDWMHRRWNPPMHEGLAQIEISVNPVRKTENGLEIFIDDEWMSLAEINEYEDYGLEILQPGESITDELVKDLKMETWLLFARIGIL